MVVAKGNKFAKVCLSFDLTDVEVSVRNMEWISSSIAGRAHKYFNNLAITWNEDKWMVMWMNAKMIYLGGSTILALKNNCYYA